MLITANNSFSQKKWPPQQPLSMLVSTLFPFPSNLGVNLQFYKILAELQVQLHSIEAPNTTNHFQ